MCACVRIFSSSSSIFPFGLFDFACTSRTLYSFQALPHTQSNLLNRLTCISTTCDNQLISNWIFCFGIYIRKAQQSKAISIHYNVLVDALTMRPFFLFSQSQNFKALILPIRHSSRHGFNKPDFFHEEKKKKT